MTVLSFAARLLAVIYFLSSVCGMLSRQLSVKRLSTSSATKLYTSPYSTADQKKRNAEAIAEQNERVLNLESIYDPSFLNGKVALVTGGNRGIGLSLVKELIASGCSKVIATSRSPAEVLGAQVISGIDVTDNKVADKLVTALKGQKIDILINNAGYFYEPVETLSTLNFEEEIKMIDICALGPLRITAALVNANLLPEGSKVAIISSQGGSVTWRFVQNPNGQDYGHHMSKAAANMAGVLLAQELRSKKIAVVLLHPGFNKTGMTKKYEAIWEEEGAVDASLGAKRVIHEIGQMSMATTGSFINCEDGKLIPY